MQHKHFPAARRQLRDGRRQPVELAAGIDMAVVAGHLVGAVGQFGRAFHPGAARGFHPVPVDRQVECRSTHICCWRGYRLARRFGQQVDTDVMHHVVCRTAVGAEAPAQQVDQLVVVTNQRGEQGQGGRVAGHRSKKQNGKAPDCK
ncbi:hypothetical protein MAFF211491_31500 [Ralstonia solanacearum]|nr:hypothetical protein MAFF211491_31500 [Ralstonia solanacearum]